MATVNLQLEAATSFSPPESFAQPELEEQFRLHQLKGDLTVGRWCVAFTLPGTFLFIPSDYAFLGNTPLFWAAQGVRAIFVAASVWTLLLLRGQPTPRSFDRTLLAWSVLCAAFMTFIAFTRPPGYLGQALLIVVAVVTTFCVLPLPFKLQWVPAILLIVGGLPTCMRQTDETGRLAAVAVAGGFFSGALLGAAESWRRQRAQRELFATARREAAPRVSLKKALDEIKTLRGIHAVCCYCKKMRDEEGAWQQFEVYVRDRTYAQFSHGICPQCYENALKAV